MHNLERLAVVVGVLGGVRIWREGRGAYVAHVVQWQGSAIERRETLRASTERELRRAIRGFAGPIIGACSWDAGLADGSPVDPVEMSAAAWDALTPAGRLAERDRGMRDATAGIRGWGQ